MHDPEHPQRFDLYSWDWMAELRAQERNLMWLARRSGIHYQEVYRISRGKRPTIERLEAIARALGRPL
jgi:hypothetical protein